MQPVMKCHNAIALFIALGRADEYTYTRQLSSINLRTGRVRPLTADKKHAHSAK
jgi:hypothetical protein